MQLAANQFIVAFIGSVDRAGFKDQPGKTQNQFFKDGKICSVNSALGTSYAGQTGIVELVSKGTVISADFTAPIDYWRLVSVINPAQAKVAFTNAQALEEALKEFA